ncbi:MAG: BrnA antitoxin family protein [Patescibacteria group bacterium]
MNKQLKPLPRFANEDEERTFWDTHDSTEYIDWNAAKKVSFPNLKPTSKTITLRLPINLLETIKIEANKRDVPYQSYIKMKLGEAFGIYHTS